MPNSLSLDELRAENARLRAALRDAGIDAQRLIDRQAVRDVQHRTDLAVSRAETAQTHRDAQAAQSDAAQAARAHTRRMGEASLELATSQELVAELTASRAALTLSEARQRAIFDSSIDFAMVVTDPDGIVTDWNPGAERAMGWTADEMRGRDAERFFTPEDRARGRVAHEMGRALETGRANDERWHLRKDGREFWASGEMMVLRADDGTHLGFVKILRDRTEQRLAAERQRADAEFMRSVLASSADCIKVLDLEAGLTFMNEGGLAVMEVSDFNTVRGCPWPSFWRDRGQDDAWTAFEAAKAGGIGHFQGGADTLKGTPKWWDVQVTPIRGADGAPEKLLVVSRDITAQKLVERRLSRSEQRWRGLFEGMHEGFFLGELIRDAAGRAFDYRFVEINPAFARQSGLPVDSVGRTIRSFVPDIDQGLIDTYARVVETGEPALFEITVPVLARTFEVRANREQADRFGCLFLDITERKRAETRQAATVALGDRLRDQTDKGAIARIAAEILGRTLGLSHAGYGHVDGEAETVTVADDWSAPGLAGIAGVHHFRTYGSYIEELKAGRDVVIADVETDPRTAPDAAALAEIDTRAILNLPVMEHGRFVALLYALTPRAHDWPPEDVQFVRSVLDRTRAAIARVEAEEEQAVLNLELSHRLKNTLALVQSIASQTLRNARDMTEAREALAARLVALGKSHDILLGGRTNSAAITAVIEGALSLHQDRHGRFRLSGPELNIGPSAALSLSLMLHELATNAAKYGALSRPGGAIDLRWAVHGSGTEAAFELTWTEQGGPPVTPPRRTGFGSRLIQRGLAGGSVAMRYPREGVVCRLATPVAELMAGS